MKKGQAAMEFLMTYGWAILVVLAAIGALAYFGVLSPDKFLPDKCTVNPPFSCTEYKVNSSHVQMKIVNNAGVDASVVNVNLTSVSPACSEVIAATGTTPNGDAVNNGLLVFSCASGTNSKFKGSILIDYTKSGETVSHATTGTIQAKVE